MKHLNLLTRVEREALAEKAVLYYTRQRRKSMRRVAERLQAEGWDVSHEWVRSQIHAAGVKPHNNYTARPARTVRYERTDGTEVTLTLRGSHSAEAVCAVLRAYESGGCPTELATRHGVPLGTLEKWLVRAGVGRDSREAAVNRRIAEGRISTIARRKRVAALYRGDDGKPWSTCRLAKHFGVTTAVVLDDLAAEGVETRDRATALLIRHHGSLAAYHAKQALIRQLKGEGLTHKEIRQRTGHCYRFIADAIAAEAAPVEEAHPEPAAPPRAEPPIPPEPIHDPIVRAHVERRVRRALSLLRDGCSLHLDRAGVGRVLRDHEVIQVLNPSLTAHLSSRLQSEVAA